MTLRLRLLLGYGYLVVLVLLAAGSALFGFLQLSAGIGTVIEENFDSVTAASRMMEAIERQDSATLEALLESRPPGEEMAEHERAFVAALEQALEGISEGEETEILRQLDRDYQAYRRAREELLAAPPERPVASYEREVAPRFLDVKLGLFRLLDVNQRAIAEADRRARQAALANGAWLGALVAVSLISFVFLSRAMQHHILSRLEQLRSASEAVADGDTRRRLLDRADDELGQVAIAVNRLLDRLQETEGRVGAEVRAERRTALALLAGYGPDAAIFDLDGRLLAGEPDEASEVAVEDWAAEEGRRRIEEAGSPASDDGPVVVELSGGLEARLLWPPAGPPVGWLVQPVAASGNPGASDR